MASGSSKAKHRIAPDALGYRQLTSHSWSPWELGKSLLMEIKRKKDTYANKSEPYFPWHNMDVQISEAKASGRAYC